MHSLSESSDCLTTLDHREFAGMSSAQPPIPDPVHASPKEPRQLTAEDLAFISKYTGRPAEALRRHILDVWSSAKKQVDPAHFVVLSFGPTFPVPERRCGMPSCLCNSALIGPLRFSPRIISVHRLLCICASKNSAFWTLR